MKQYNNSLQAFSVKRTGLIISFFFITCCGILSTIIERTN